MKKFSDELKANVNERHVQIYNKLLDNVEFFLDTFSSTISSASFENHDLPKTTIATLDFFISAIVKIQKGQRTALGLDENNEDIIEPQLSIIEGADFNKI